MMSKLIDDLTWFRGELRKGGKTSEYYEAQVDIVSNAIYTIETLGAKVRENNLNNGWIPCEERLPEDNNKVLVWFEYFRYGEYNRLFQTIGIDDMFQGKWSRFVNGQSGWRDLKIIAWQPLPKPYQMKD